MFDFLLFFDIISKREVYGTNTKYRHKCGTVEKLFIIKPVCCFKLITVSNVLNTFETDGSFCLYNRA